VIIQQRFLMDVLNLQRKVRGCSICVQRFGGARSFKTWQQEDIRNRTEIIAWKSSLSICLSNPRVLLVVFLILLSWFYRIDLEYCFGWGCLAFGFSFFVLFMAFFVSLSKEMFLQHLFVIRHATIMAWRVFRMMAWVYAL